MTMWVLPVVWLAAEKNIRPCWTDSHICPPHQEESHSYVDLCIKL